MSRLGFVWLGATAVALAAVIAGEIAGSAPQLPAVAIVPRPTSGGAMAGPPAAGTEAHWMTVILTRPLFAPSRQAPGGSAAPAGALRLSGVIVGPSGRQAIFEPPAGGKPVVVGVGERVGGAVVRSIGPDLVLMTGVDGPRVLRPSFGPAGGTVAAALSRPVPRIQSMAVRLMKAK